MYPPVEVEAAVGTETRVAGVADDEASIRHIISSIFKNVSMRVATKFLEGLSPLVSKYGFH